MLHHSPSGFAPAPPLLSLRGGGPDVQAGPDANLLDLAEPVEDTRVLLIGSDTLELICALVRRGCASAATVRLGERTAAAGADIAVIPHVETGGCADIAVAQARHALAPLGSLVMRLVADPSGAVSAAALRALQRHGFSAIRSRMQGRQLVLTAELPLLGRLAQA